MKRIALAVAAATMFVLPSPLGATSQGVLGLWATGSEGGKVEIYRCGNAVCGRIVDADKLRQNPDQRDARNSDPSLRDRKLKGLVVLRGFTGGPTKWEGGPVYDPESGDGAKKGYLTLRADGNLEVKGCKAAIFCRTKVWTRIR